MDRILVLTPYDAPDPAIPIAACRAGACGIVDLGWVAPAEGSEALEALADAAGRHGSWGARWDARASNDPSLRAWTDGLAARLPVLVLAGVGSDALASAVVAARRVATEVLIETSCAEDALRAQAAGCDGVVVKGREAGGVVNEAATAGRTEPYELAATWRSLCTVGVDGPFTDDELVARHLAGHAVALALRGIPLLYVHSLVASANARDRHAATGIARDLNRARFTSPEAFRAALGADDRISARAWRGLQAMLGWRRSQPVFHPDVAQRIHPGDGGVIVIERGPVAAEGALVAVNLTGHTETVDVGDGWIDLADGEEAPTALTLGPWSHRWFSRPGRPTPRPVSAR